MTTNFRTLAAAHATVVDAMRTITKLIDPNGDPEVRAALVATHTRLNEEQRKLFDLAWSQPTLSAPQRTQLLAADPVVNR
jgi:hypothetical protein